MTTELTVDCVCSMSPLASVNTLSEGSAHSVQPHLGICDKAVVGAPHHMLQNYQNVIPPYMHVLFKLTIRVCGE